MVLAERSNDVRNGKRSRGPSPNGHGSPDSSSEDENGMKSYQIELIAFKLKNRLKVVTVKLILTINWEMRQIYPVAS